MTKVIIRGFGFGAMHIAYVEDGALIPARSLGAEFIATVLSEGWAICGTIPSSTTRTSEGRRLYVVMQPTDLVVSRVCRHCLRGNQLDAKPFFDPTL